MCCYGAAINGPHDCTCWEPVHDTEQHPPLRGKPATRAKMCNDCAFRPDSPERQGDERYGGDTVDLDGMVWSGEPFYCHQGMRRIVIWRHPVGTKVDAGPDHYYDPPDDTLWPHKADGTPADICAGWAARRRAYERELEEDAS